MRLRGHDELCNFVRFVSSSDLLVRVASSLAQRPCGEVGVV
jgi:hypothetical protein